MTTEIIKTYKPKENAKGESSGNSAHCGEILQKINLLNRIKDRKLEYDKEGKIKISGIPTRFVKLDEKIDGLQDGHLIILGARTGMGKTFFALNLMKNISIENNIRSDLFSLEMSNSQTFYRLVALISGIEYQKIKRGMINDEELYSIEKAVTKIETSSLYLTDEPGNSTYRNLHNNIENACKNGSKVIFIDHIGLVSFGSDYRENRAIELGKISSSIKILAKKYETPMFCLAQLNRDADNKEPPKLSNLRESGSLEQDADIVLFLHRRDYYDKNDKPGKATVIIAKNREGDTGDIDFNYSNTWILKEEESLEAIRNQSNIQVAPPRPIKQQPNRKHHGTESTVGKY